MTLHEVEYYNTLYPWLKHGDGCWAENIPDGWWNSFGAALLEDLAEAIQLDGLEDVYSISDVKEKYGTLRWYGTSSSRVDEVLDRYEEISGRTCIRCGKRAHWISRGWIAPYCDTCKRELAKNGQEFIKVRDLPQFSVHS